MERKLFTALQGEGAERLHDSLSKQGFRRSQNVLYRPTCAECSACLSARIDVAAFTASRTQRRVLRRNHDLLRQVTSPWASEEHYTLFRRYLDQRHADGGMADMDSYEFAAMIEESPIRTRLVEYTATGTGSDALAAREGALVAACLTDLLDDGLSLVYSFYDPDLTPRSLGSYVILDHIDLARSVGLPYVYLGYWVPGSPKMGYKAAFSGLEVYKGGNWQPIGDPGAHEATLHPLSVDPIAEQVARITLPDGLARRR